MTRVGIISDIHGDIDALRDALARIEASDCDVTICTGDIASYGVFPEESIQLLRAHGVVRVGGNHDGWAVGRRADDDPQAADPNEAFDALGWGLSEASVAFLARLPDSWRTTIAGVRLVAVHARPGSKVDGVYPEGLSLDEADQMLADVEAWSRA